MKRVPLSPLPTALRDRPLFSGNQTCGMLSEAGAALRCAIRILTEALFIPTAPTAQT
jgi:hypothetical protein